VAGRVAALVSARHKIDFERWLEFDPPRLADHWRRTWKESVLPEALSRFATDFEKSELARILRSNRPDHEAMESRRRRLLAEVPALPQGADPVASLREIREQAKVQGGGGPRVWPSPETYEAVKDGLKALRSSADEILDWGEGDAETAQQAAEYGLGFLRLTRSASQAYEQSKDTAGMLDFDDLLYRARDLLRDHREVRTDVVRRLALLMVDELQDTDAVQVELVRLLCGKRLKRGGLFIVGDHKQSIYRFRGAEPQVFHRLREELPAEGRQSLTVNFRSQPAILDFVNALFADAMGDGYEPLRSNFQQLTPTPAVELLLAPSAEEKENVETMRRREARRIAQRIRSMLDGGERLVVERDRDHGTETLRETRPGDVALLFRALSDVRYYEEALREREIPYYLVGGHAFYAQQEIFDLANLLGAVENAGDVVRLVGALRSPFFSLEDETLYWLAGDDHDLARGLSDPTRRQRLAPDQRRRVEFADEALGRLRSKKDRVPIARLVNEALDLTGYDAALLAEFLGRRQLANLHKLIDTARQFDRAGLFTLADFIEELEQFVAEQPRESQAALHPETGNVVRLMTIHQAKGLEFPVVFVPDLGRPSQDRLDDALFDPELGPIVGLPASAGKGAHHLGRDLLRCRDAAADLAESVRLLYVATTRAADYLVLSSSVKRIDGEGTSPGLVVPSQSPWMPLLAERFDLETGECRAKLPDGWPSPRMRKTPQSEEAAGRAATRGANLENLVDQIRAGGAGNAPLDAIQPIPISGAGRRQFSVSQIENVVAEPVRRDGERHRVEVDDLFRPGLMESATVRGSVVHAALERVSFRDPGDLKPLVAQCWAEHDPAHPDQDVSDLVALLERFLGSETARRLADADACYRELEFMLRWPPDAAGSVDQYLRGFIDCLYRDSEGWHLLDFKTNRVAAEDVATVSAEYTLQLVVYALAGERLIKGPLKSAGLYFLEPGVRWTTSLAPEARREVVAQVDAAMAALRRT
jgi:ATP-dependent helicase/nuclease subunit A